MPPKRSVKSNSTTKALVKTGPRDVSVQDPTKRGLNRALPTTARALVLRNSKYGAFGTGEVVLVSKLTGREKLDLLAEDLTEKASKALSRPFKLAECLDIAESQFNAYLDELSNLNDPDMFSARIVQEFVSRKPSDAKGKVDPVSQTASLVGIIIHNAYLQASAWRLVFASLRELEAAGLENDTIKQQLKNSASIRSRYLALYDLVNVLVNVNQQKFSVLATTTPHYAPYFKKTETDDPEVVFQWDKLKDACRSFVDSIIIELCFPRAPYPRFVLYQLLRDAIEESPDDGQRFPQALWDAIGDLSVVVELQELLEGPLLGPEGDALKSSPHDTPKEYGFWFDAQVQSEKASRFAENYERLIYPLNKTRDRRVLENMWKSINLNYKSVCGKTIETLWQLDNIHRTPQWHSFYFPGAHEHLSPDEPEPRMRPRPRLALTNASDDEEYASMPDLQSLSSDSEDSDDEDGDSYPDEQDALSEGDDEYDEEREDELRDLRREAMDLAHDIPGFFDHHASIPNDVFAEERKGNPFLKLLGSLRGRMFSSNPRLKTPISPKTAKSSSAAQGAEPAASELPKLKVPPAPIAGASQDRKVTVEEVEDEDVAQHGLKKKKRKKKKKAAPSSDPTVSSTATQPLPSPSSVSESVSRDQPKAAPSASPTVLHQKDVSTPSSSNVNASTLTLPPIQQTAAQSARKYLKSEKLDSQKTKIKSRPDPATSSAPEKKGFFSRFTKEKSTIPESEMKQAKQSWFVRLTKKGTALMKQLLRTSDDETKGLAPMKWEHFLKLMKEMGFSIESSTAGSSVRFDPPDPRDKSITFHKPHPDPTINPNKLRSFSKRLKDYYGWKEEDLIKNFANSQLSER